MKKAATLVMISLISHLSLATDSLVKKLQLPSGFHIAIYANNLKGAREIAIGEKNTIFVGSKIDKVYAVISSEENPKKHKVIIIASGLNQPTGVAFYKNDLYVAEIDKIIRFNNIESHLDNPPKPETIFNHFPEKTTEGHYHKHAWRYIRFSPDGKLYVTVGAPCDTCLNEDKRIGTIMRMNPDGSHAEIYASGIRNSVGLDWSPVTHKLWFTDNGRDRMGDNIPPNKLNYAPEKGLDFGFPYYHGKDNNGNPISDPKYGKLKSTAGITWPAFQLPAHVAALGMSFYDGDMFPKRYLNQLFITEHGSWNRSEKIGYTISLIQFANNKPVSYKPFITGWKVNGKYWGRPVDIKLMPDGSMLISDDYANVIYRVSYQVKSG